MPMKNKSRLWEKRLLSCYSAASAFLATFFTARFATGFFPSTTSAERGAADFGADFLVALAITFSAFATEAPRTLRPL